jgi:hypothetical protein
MPIWQFIGLRPRPAVRVRYRNATVSEQRVDPASDRRAARDALVAHLHARGRLARRA